MQAVGLVGPDGLLPAGDFLSSASQRLGAEAYRRFPTLLWMGAGEPALHLICASGSLLSLLVLAGVWQLPCLSLLWALYLSIVVGGQDFMSFQWDVLLLEAGLYALFLAPTRRRAALADRLPPPAIGIWLFRLLVFKLMFLSGITKVLSWDETWWNLTALHYHYFTQPLPWWTSWYVHQLPGWVDQVSVALLLSIEIVAPWLIFAGRRPRILACALLVGLQLTIAWTGNYGFFNFLALALCLSLLDDRFFESVLPLLRSRRLPPPSSRDLRAILGRGGIAGTLRSVGAAALILVSALTVVREMVMTAASGGRDGPLAPTVSWLEHNLLEPTRPLLQAVAPLRSINGYGLFRSMTTTRPEIVFEGSDDGATWSEIEFRWKPGDVSRRPRLVAPHHPRLDWQMWFAALSPRQAAPWLDALAKAILNGEHDVLALLPAQRWTRSPPRHLRFRYWSYTFTDPAEREATGNWWKRSYLGELTPPVSLGDL